jgi:hypothetical protein
VFLIEEPADVGLEDPTLALGHDNGIFADKIDKPNVGKVRHAGAATTFWDKTLGTLTALTATNCERTSK